MTNNNNKKGKKKEKEEKKFISLRALLSDTNAGRHGLRCVGHTDSHGKRCHVQLARGRRLTALKSELQRIVDSGADARVNIFEPLQRVVKNGALCHRHTKGDAHDVAREWSSEVREIHRGKRERCGDVEEDGEDGDDDNGGEGPSNAAQSSGRRRRK